jgi:hypothetical protein
MPTCPLLNKECIQGQCSWWISVWGDPNKCALPVLRRLLSLTLKETMFVKQAMGDLRERFGCARSDD